jgi:tripartite ATP-independent transporter DctM subunit
MLKRNYNPKLATGVVAAGGFLGIEIPPSGNLVIFGFIAGVSIGKLLVATIFPGILTATLFFLGTHLMCRIWPSLGPPSGVKFSVREKIAASFGLWEVAFIFIAVMGGIYLGIFTVTEAGAVGTLITLVMLLLRGRGRWAQVVVESMQDAAEVTCMIFVIFIGATFFNLFLIQAGVPNYVSELIVSAPYSPRVLIYLILAFYIPLGMFLDPVSILFVTVPIFQPVMESLGYDTIWYGIICVQMVELSLITPPVGLNCFLVKAICPPEISLNDIFIGAAPYFVLEVIVVILLVTFPEIALWLPGKMLG